MKSLKLVLILSVISLQSAFARQNAIDYASQVQTIFNAKCVSCHGGQSGVTLSSYTNTMNSVGTAYKVKIVNPGNAGASPLVEKIKPNPSLGNRMPPGGSLSSDDISIIEAWVNQGANSVVTSIEEVEESLTFNLLGNYPNPFNPSTQVRFSLSANSVVTLQVYDLQGKEVFKKAESFSAGVNYFGVNLSNQTSGLYLYRVTAIDVNRSAKVLSGKMMLVK